MQPLILILLIIILTQTTLLTIKPQLKLFHQRPRRKVYIDTSTLIDGRILSVATAGFIGDDLIIPRSVIRELQLLADGTDPDKRARARFGLDIIRELERVISIDIKILQDALDHTKVDERLIELAKKNKGLIMTNDFNLGKVATTEGIEVLNVNDLAQGLRSEFLPGEKLKITIVQKGNSPHQGVGYLKDGTMVVIDDAASHIDQSVEIEFVRFLQTSAGKMMFAKLVKPKNPITNPRSPKRNIRPHRAQSPSPSSRHRH
jgi:uncharacterized protein YacL